MQRAVVFCSQQFLAGARTKAAISMAACFKQNGSNSYEEKHADYTGDCTEYFYEGFQRGLPPFKRTGLFSAWKQRTSRGRTPLKQEGCCFIVRSRDHGRCNGSFCSFDRFLIRAPESVQIAEGINGLCFVSKAKEEASLWMVSRRQFLELETVSGAKPDPGDAVAVCHGMAGTADLYHNRRAGSGENGNVLFGSTICAVGYKFLHGVTTADGGDSGIGEDSDDFPTGVAVIKTQIHFQISFI